MNERKASAKRSQVAAEWIDFEPLLPDRMDTVALGEEQLPVRRGSDKVDYVPADDLMLEALINRALSKKQYSAIVDLYARLDVEEEATLLRRQSRATPAQREALNKGLAQVSSMLSRQRDQLIALRVAQMERGTLKVSPWVRHRLTIPR